MKAMILAAGYGTRLGAMSQTTPKCLVPAGGVPMLERVVDRLKAAGVTSVVINIHHLASLVEDFVNSRNGFGIEVAFSREDPIRGTGGGIKHARTLLEGEEFFLVHNADIYTDFDLASLIERHRESSSMVTLAVRDQVTESVLVLDSSLRLCGWVNRGSNTENVLDMPTHPTFVTFTGIHIASTEVFDYFEREEEVFSIFTPYMKAVADGKLISALHIRDAYWIDIGTPEKLKELELHLREESAVD